MTTDVYMEESKLLELTQLANGIEQLLEKIERSMQ